MANLGYRWPSPSIQSPVTHKTTTDASAHGHVEDALLALPCPKFRFGQGGDIAIVADDRGQADAPGEVPEHRGREEYRTELKDRDGGLFHA